MKRVKNISLLLLQLIEQKIPIHSDSKKRDSITKRLGKSKQALNYHLQKLVKEDILNHVQSFPYAIYELTSLGEILKKNLIQSQHIKNLWRCHNLIVGFPIKTFGTFRFIDTENRKIIPMKNWNYAREQVKDFVINIQDTGLLKIYCPQKYSINPDQEFGKMYAESQSIAQRYCDRYGMVLEPMKVIRSGHKALLKSSKLAQVLGKFKADGVWTDESNGTHELEEEQNEYKVEELFELPDRMKSVEDAIIKQSEVNEKLSRNIELHFQVLNEIRDAIKELKEVMKR
jgi:hypothetical protein